MTQEIGDKPAPAIEPAETYPGGVDAIWDDDRHPVVPDLAPEDNPAVEDAAPDELKEPEDTDTGASSDGASEPEKEDQA